MKTALKILASLCISVIALYAASRNVEWHELRRILAGVKLWPLAAAAAVSLSTFGLRSVRWKILLQPFQEVPVSALFRWQVGGLLINNLLPLRMGELARAYWAGHKTRIPKTTILATIVIERLADLISLVLLATGLLLSLGLMQSRFSISGGQLAVLSGLALAGAFAVKDAAPRLLGEGRWKKFMPSKIHTHVERFFSGMRVLESKSEIAKLLSISVVIWSVDIGAVALVSYCLDLNLTWRQAGMTMVGLVLGVMVPAAPGAAGTYEAGGVAALSLMGFAKTLSLSFILLLHAFQYLLVFALGVPILIAEGFKPQEMMAEMESEQGQGG